MARGWNEFDKFSETLEKYLPAMGEGETMATQIATAVCKLVYKWFNDGDVYDNTGALDGWCNDLSSYANWLHKYMGLTCLEDIHGAWNDDDYEEILYAMCVWMADENLLTEMDKREKVGSVYDCDGEFRFEEYEDEDDWY